MSGFYISMMISRTVVVIVLRPVPICHSVWVAFGSKNCHQHSVDRFMLKQACERVPAAAKAVAAGLLLFFWLLLLEVEYLRYLLAFLISKEDFSF